MARMLGRSRSLRILKGGHKETHQQETSQSTPPPADAQVGFDRLKVATPVSRADGRVETPDMLQRPKTSGGPGDRGKLFHKKVAPVAPISTDDNAFVFPFPSPTKSTSATVLYTAEVHEDKEEGIIGIALGSPTMAAHWNPTSHATDFISNNQGTITHISSTSPSHTVSSPLTEPNQDAPKPKLSRWKSLFKKNASPPQEKASFYKLAQPVSQPRVDSHHDNDSIEEDPRAGSPPTFRPEIRESRKLPKGQIQPATETRPRALTVGVTSLGKTKPSSTQSAESPRPPPKDYSPTVPQVMISGGSQMSSPRSNGEKPLLDVDIPTVHMERYSVMFSSLLQPGSSGPSSLLARRQGNSDRLKPLTELSAKRESERPRNGTLKPPQRRATSPIPRSPSAHLSLFPSTSSNHLSRAPSPRAVSIHRPRPLQRSKTAPAASPSRESFPLAKEPDTGTNEMPQDARKFERENADSGMKTQLLTPTPSSPQSFDSDSEEVTIVVAQAAPGQTWKPRMDNNEPEWEIVSKPAKITKASALSSHPSSAPLEPPSRADHLKISQTQLSPAPRSADMPITKTENGPQAATVGVARSVSVSRANKPELLKPIFVKRATDSSERIVDKKSLTPTLVELENRRSQRVQLVDA